MIPPLTEKAARDLMRDIAKNSKDVIVKQGMTNGQIVLHVIEHGRCSTTIKSAAEWDVHPANEKHTRNTRFAKEQATEAMMSSNEGTTQSA
jgi:hypothetical protein